MTALLTHTPAPRRKTARLPVVGAALTAALTAADSADPAAPAVSPAVPGPAPDAATAAAQVMAVLPGVMDAMRRVMRSQLDGPLTVPQFRGLNFIDHHPGSSVSALAGFLGVTLATASAMADRLVRAGYLQSRGSATDRRRTELQLCASGKAVLDRMRHQTQSDLAGSLQACTPQQLTALVDGLAVLALAFPRTESL
jgi:DNA-binding MarR family transcriptional regulator